MKKLLLFLILVFLSSFVYGENNGSQNSTAKNIEIQRGILMEDTELKTLYNEFGLQDKLNYKIFKMALNGYSKIQNKKKPYLVIVDYTKPSYEKRFLLLNMENKTLEYYTYVAHGKNSGIDKAISFSNKVNSYKSSLGFYLTGITYNGKFGLSLKLHGLEDHYNSNAYERGVIIHGSDNSEEKYIENYGFLGRTEGCPALPTSLHKEIVTKIKEGSVLFIFANDSKYIRDSKYIK